MAGAKSAQSTVTRSVLDELVFVGRSGPVDQTAEPAPGTRVGVFITDAEARVLSRREQIARVVALVALYGVVTLLIGLAIGYAA
jgi:hypothetical protein